MRQYRHLILLFFIASALRIGLWAQSTSLGVDMGKDSLRISARPLHFLSDKELEKLHDGLTVTLDIELTVVTEHTAKPLYRAEGRFAFSFDLWEEKYSVFRSPPDGRSVSHLSAASAEEWCLKNMPIPLDVFPDQEAFMIQLESIIEENDREKNLEDAPGLSIPGLIEYFSRKKSEKPHFWKASTGLLRLHELNRTGKTP